MQNDSKENSAQTDNLEARINKLEIQIQAIIDRNNRVEDEKAWETSNTRRLSIVAITYLMMSLFMFVIEVRNPLLNAMYQPLDITSQLSI